MAGRPLPCVPKQPDKPSVFTPTPPSVHPTHGAVRGLLCSARHLLAASTSPRHRAHCATYQVTSGAARAEPPGVRAHDPRPHPRAGGQTHCVSGHEESVPEGQSGSTAGAELAQGPVGLRGHTGPPGQGHGRTQPGAAMSHAVVRVGRGAAGGVVAHEDSGQSIGVLLLFVWF